MSTDRENWDHTGQCTACAEKQYPVEQCNHVRGGKTRREHADGTHGDRFSNRAQRVTWMASGEGNSTFPKGSCNGKRNRFLT
jgi:hypothetical protein